jgi:hypothetical protein
MPWPKSKHEREEIEGASLVSEERRWKQDLLRRNYQLWCEILRQQLPRAIRNSFVFTLQVGFEGDLKILMRKAGSQTKYDINITFPVSANIVNTLKLPDEFVAMLCVLV